MARGGEANSLVLWTTPPSSPHRERRAFDPFSPLFHGLHLPQPEAADQFLGLGEGSVDYSPLLSRKSDPLALGAGLQPLACKHYAGLYQLLVELAHGSKSFLGFLGR